MKTIFFPDQTLNDGTYAATIGFFDGVHKGHQFLMERLEKEAAKRGLKSMVITFERHPRQVVQGDWKPELLTELHEKLKLLKATNIDVVVVLRFNRQMAGLSAGEFMQLMHDRLGVRMLLTGYDNRFGHDRTEGFEDYQRYGQELGIEVMGGEALTLGEQNVSSSLVRRLLKAGNVEEATRCLGRPYGIGGQVVHGEQIGRTIGFPTANLLPDDNKLIPQDGVYAVMVDLDNGVRKQGIMNIGTRPTFNGTTRTLETNLLETVGDLYGQRIFIHFIGRLRSEQHFPSADALAKQIQKDIDQAKDILNQDI
jgi:riboflavin kinase/FMN adenylyltransferase